MYSLILLITFLSLIKILYFVMIMMILSLNTRVIIIRSSHSAAHNMLKYASM